jgi:hypothetical protein
MTSFVSDASVWGIICVEMDQVSHVSGYDTVDRISNLFSEQHNFISL